MGITSAAGRERAGLKYVRAMPEPELEAALRACCGSTSWIRAMMSESVPSTRSTP